MAGNINAFKDAEGFLNVEVPGEYGGKTVAEALRLMGLDVDLPCGGSGRCGKCGAYVKTKDDPASGERFVRICSTKVTGDGGLTVRLPEKLILGNAGAGTPETLEFSVKFEADGRQDAFLAADIGTTTVEAVLVYKGRPAEHFALLNPQKKYGADVISRIAFSEKEGGLERMTADIRACIGGILKKCREDHPGIAVSELYVAGNTTMQHIFYGATPAGIGRYPFTPVFTETKSVKGKDLGLPVENVTILPSADAFIGADVVAGAALYLTKKDRGAELFIDLGTNGEMVLRAGDRYLATSSAAGPCFEGANISCGTGGIEGAISSVTDPGNGVSFRTIGNKKPSGICGSGLLSLVALLLEKNIIDETGLMGDDHEIAGLHDTGKGGEYLNTGLFLTKKDVREFQLAKAAIRTGIDILLEKGGVRAADVSTVYTAGGLGSFIDPEAALKTGLFPPEFANKTVSPGNTSLEGAVRAGSDPSFVEKAGELASKIETFSLNDVKEFNTRFVDNMYFE